jgi:hypothetical protein
VQSEETQIDLDGQRQPSMGAIDLPFTSSDCTRRTLNDGDERHSYKWGGDEESGS